MSVSKDTSGRLQAIAVRNIEFFRPKPADIPWQLLSRGAAEQTLESLEQTLDMDYTRVANRIEPAATIGVYSMRRLDEGCYELISLAVAAEFEHQLVGRRLLGHALGLAESKAATEVVMKVCADNARALDTTQRYGFVLDEAEAEPPKTKILRFELTPE